MHLEQGLPNPLEENHRLQLLLRGVRRVKGDSTTRKLPITPLLLLKIRSVLDLQDPNSTVFWAACLTTFFGMLRRSNVLPTPPFSDTKHLHREDVLAYSWGLALEICWSKTIQFRERELLVPLPHLPGHPLDPTQAIRKAFQVTAKAPAGGPAFVFPGSLASFTPTKFATMLNTALKKLGLDPSAYSGHSFRRGGGGATWALESNLPPDAIKLLGDWKSDAYMAYIEIPLKSWVKYAFNMSRLLPTSY